MDEEKQLLLAAALAVAQPLLESSSSSSDSSSSEDDDTPKTPRKLPKSRKMFENIEEMDEQEFRSHFRLGYSKNSSHMYPMCRCSMLISAYIKLWFETD